MYSNNNQFSAGAEAQRYGTDWSSGGGGVCVNGDGGGDVPSLSYSRAAAQQPKASRRDHLQTTPRAHHQQHMTPIEVTPPRVRIPAPGANVVDEILDNNNSSSTGLTPLAAQMQLGGVHFQTAHPPSMPSYNHHYHHHYQHQHHHHHHQQQMFSPLGAGVGLLQPSAPPPPPLAAGLQPQPQYSYVQRNEWLQHQQYAQPQTTAPPPPIHRPDASWPILPGFPIVEGTCRPETEAPKEQVIHRHHNHHQNEDQRRLRRLSSSLRSTTTTPNTTTNHHHRGVAQPALPPPPPTSSPVTPSPVHPHHHQPSPSTPTSPSTSPIEALHEQGHLLTQYEKSEVLSFPDVWFVGHPEVQKIPGSALNGRPNAGYDDGDGNYLAVPGDHVAYRYEIVSHLGSGSFGKVLKCYDHATSRHVALKIIRNKKRFLEQAQIEADLLFTLSSQDPHDQHNLVRIYDFFAFRSHFCITFELLGTNLYEHIKAGGFRGMSMVAVQHIAVQVLQSLVFLRALNIAHCDLKPENILLSSSAHLYHQRGGSATVKVIDFGSSCYADQRVFSYIQSRFYRAPEVILGLDYGCPIDMWSLGCVLAELLLGVPLFPGEHQHEQMACICEVLGTPSLSLLHQGKRSHKFFCMSTGAILRIRPNSEGKVHRQGTVTLTAAMKGRGSAAFLDFLKRCLQWDPLNRLTPERALQHPWIADVVAEFQNVSTPGSSSSSSRSRSRSRSRTGAALPAKRQLKQGQGHQQQRMGPLGEALAALVPSALRR